MKSVVQIVRTRIFGDHTNLRMAFITVGVKPVIMNGLSESPSHSSSRDRTSDRPAAPAAKAQAVGRKILCVRSTLRISSSPAKSLLLVIYQLLLKNNTKYDGVFWRNVRAVLF